jgi:hypothetical protein
MASTPFADDAGGQERFTDDARDPDGDVPL